MWSLYPRRDWLQSGWVSAQSCYKSPECIGRPTAWIHGVPAATQTQTWWAFSQKQLWFERGTQWCFLIFRHPLPVATERTVLRLVELSKVMFYEIPPVTERHKTFCRRTRPLVGNGIMGRVCLKSPRIRRFWNRKVCQFGLYLGAAYRYIRPSIAVSWAPHREWKAQHLWVSGPRKMTDRLKEPRTNCSQWELRTLYEQWSLWIGGTIFYWQLTLKCAWVLYETLKRHWNKWEIPN